MKCGICGVSLSIVAGDRSYGHHARYGCSQHFFYRGSCRNGLLIRRDWLEKDILSELQGEVLTPEAVEHVLDVFERHLKGAFAGLTDRMAEMCERRQQIEGERERLTETAAVTGPSAFLISAINKREQQLRELSEQLLGNGEGLSKNICPRSEAL